MRHAGFHIALFGLLWGGSTFLSVILTGCGVYSFTGQGIGGIKTIAVEPFDNRTAEFGIQEELTDAVINQLLGNRTLTVASQANAEGILRGAIISVDDLPLTFREDEEATEYLVVITVEVSLVRPGRSEPLWSARLVGEGNYPYQTGSPDERREGIEKAVQTLVQDLVNRLTSDW